MRASLLLCALWLVAMTWPSAGLSLPAESVRVLFYNPDANLKNVGLLKHRFQTYLASKMPNIRFQPFRQRPLFEKALAEKQFTFAIVSALFYPEVASKYALRPILAPAWKGSLTYRKVLVTVDSGADGKKLKNASLAMTVVSDKASLLGKLGLDVNKLRLVKVSKDIDALLALSFRQVDLALVSPQNVEVLRRVNPQALLGLRVLAQTEPILRAPLCIVGADVPDDVVSRVTAIFREMPSDERGSKVMQVLGIDQWRTISPEQFRQ